MYKKSGDDDQLTCMKYTDNLIDFGLFWNSNKGSIEN